MNRTLQQIKGFEHNCVMFGNKMESNPLLEVMKKKNFKKTYYTFNDAVSITIIQNL